ncbi:Enolase N terminal domain [Trypanosoma vivax]|uniref:phosphopyruvate hydratase n=1 Tax=Trypanosoma vivax (strain Y486) TaxID=1055687 RepID=G0U9G5_TRYVY|nr:putative enolase [Trypanosoma vivax]KAH8605046.1 Enolase N terminal domain [Trypanosoma vivax]CCC54251.1 putative enolase [Trypanosoma vivax Y486]
MESISWRLYDQQHDLSRILTLAARSCVDVRASRPAEYLAAYFSKNCVGDEIRNFTTRTMFAPGGTFVLGLTLHLLNGMEAQSTAVLANTSKNELPAEENVDPAAVIAEVLETSYFPQLTTCGACDQKQFDAILNRISSDTDVPQVGGSVLYALSIVASSAAARCCAVPLFQHVRDTLELPLPRDTYAMPQPCINFFGPENATTARVALKDVIIIPTMNDGVLPVHVIQKIFAAFRHFSKTHNANARSDGSLAFDTFENITDAIAVAEAALRAVGLVPVEDVCVGLRLATVVANPRKEGKEVGEPLYALFPGDQEVSGAQLAEYVWEQIRNYAGFVVYLEDTHCDWDAAGIRRLHAHTGGTVAFSGYELYNQSQYTKVEQGLSDLWTSNVVLHLNAMSTLSRLYDVVRLVRSREGCTVGIASQDMLHNVPFTAHLAVGIGARYLCIGGLLNIVQCEALSHLVCVQQTLQQSRQLLEETPQLACVELPEAPTGTVPEIKRRLEKKKRKR